MTGGLQSTRMAEGDEESGALGAGVWKRWREALGDGRVVLGVAGAALAAGAVYFALSRPTEEEVGVGARGAWVRRCSVRSVGECGRVVCRG